MRRSKILDISLIVGTSNDMMRYLKETTSLSIKTLIGELLMTTKYISLMKAYSGRITNGKSFYNDLIGIDVRFVWHT